MTIYQLKHLNKGISALLPIYTEGIGDTTLLIDLAGKQRTLHAKIGSVVNGLIVLFSLDYDTIREKYGEVILQKQKIPLPFSQNLILIPFKVRKPLVKGDPAYGYINYTCIKSHEKMDKYSKIILKNGIEIPVLQTLGTTRRNLVKAKLIASILELQKHKKGLNTNSKILASSINSNETW